MRVRCVTVEHDAGMTGTIRFERAVLPIGHEYEVLGIAGDHYRIIGYSGEPCLYPSVWFEVVDAREPHFWVSSTDEDGERSASPKEWLEPGFFEDYFDYVQEVREQFRSDLARLYGIELKREE
jgi:hypothetical protein